MSAWSLIYEGFDPGQEGLRESLCTVGNGYFATRGAAPESAADGVHYPGTYVGGCFNRLKTEISSHTTENESLVNLPNWLPLTFRIEDGEWFEASQVALLEYRQELDMRQGVLSRFLRFSDGQGRHTRVFQRRFVHMGDHHLAGLETTIASENWVGTLQVRTAIDGRVANTGVERYRALNSDHLTPLESSAVGADAVYLRTETNQSLIQIAQAARTRLLRDGEEVMVERQLIEEPDYIAQEFSVEMKQGAAVTVEKIASLFTSRDDAISECGQAAREKAASAPGFDALLETHVLAWDHLWKHFSISLEDQEIPIEIFNLQIFHLLQTVSPHSIGMDIGVPARGLHGEAYRGHIFWDELFIFPLLNLRLPHLARALLQYRYRRLPEARALAKAAGHPGAMYPWQSGSDGREESQTFHLNPHSGRWLPDNSHLQRHINIAIAYNVWHYYQVTRDVDFISFYGAEVILEVARFLASISQYNRSLDRYEICRVMGPDEYHDGYPDADEPGLDNNAYTNVMTVWVLSRALDVLGLLHSDIRQTLQEKLGLRREELDRWDVISRKMRVPFHGNGIISQFEGYDQLREFDWGGYQQKYGNVQRLDRILEAEGDTPNRYKVSKQADVLMLFYLLSADELRELFARMDYPFEYETIPKNIDYYISRTCHGSTLSRVVHSWVLTRSRRDQAWQLFKDALMSDAGDSQGGTTKEGVHLGAMAGTVDLIQRCYTGIETRGDVLWFNPRLPPDLKQVQFNIRYRQHWMSLLFTHEHMRVGACECESGPVMVGLRDLVVEIKPGETREFQLGPEN